MTLNKTRGIAFLLTCLLTVSLAGQSTPFPAWYAKRRSLSRKEALALRPEIYARCAQPNLYGGDCETGWVRVGKYKLKAQQNQGVLAVLRSGWRQAQPELWGIETGLANILHLDGPFVLPGLPPKTGIILITGIDGNGTAVVKCLKVDEGEAPSEAGLHRLPVDGAKGEVYCAASFVDSKLIIFEGTRPKIIAYLDSDGDLVPDTRAPVSVDLINHPDALEAGTVYPTRVRGFRACPPSLGLFMLVDSLTFTDWDYRSRLGFDVVRMSATGVLGVHSAIVVDEGNLPQLERSGSLREGQDRILVRGRRGTSLVVETAPQESGPWAALSTPLAIKEKAGGGIVALSRPLIFGHFVRLREVEDHKRATVIRVNRRYPVLFDSTESISAWTGSKLHLRGDNLEGLTAAHLAPYATDASIPAAISSQSKHELVVTLPSGLAPKGKMTFASLVLQFRAPSDKLQQLFVGLRLRER